MINTMNMNEYLKAAGADLTGAGFETFLIPTEFVVGIKTKKNKG